MTVTVPRIWVKVDSNVVVDVVVVQLGIVSSVVKLFGSASFKVEVILHPSQSIVEFAGLRIPVVLCESVTLFLLLANVTRKLARDDFKRNLFYSSDGIEESAFYALRLSAIKCVHHEVEAICTQRRAVFAIGATLLATDHVR